VLKGHDLRLPQFAVLVALSDFGALAPHELATRLQADRSHISAYVESLVKRGWVERMQDDADRRRVTVELTPEGRLRVGELATAAGASEHALLGALSREECDTLRALLMKVIVANEISD
jgi:DNA-binding MarR family transcriptional regulator